MIDKRMDWQNNIDWEQEKHDTFFKDYYLKNNWEILEDKVGENFFYDVKIKKDKTILEIDEKAHKPRINDIGLIIELVQDFQTKNWGWFFKNDIYDFHAYWEHEKDFYPKWAYIVERKRAREWIFDKLHIRFLLENDAELRINEKGWGITLIMEIPWILLQNKTFIKKVI